MFTVVVEAATGHVLSDGAPATLGLSWQTISYLSYGAFVGAGIISGVAKVVIVIGTLLLSDLLWSLEDLAEGLCGLPVSACSGYDSAPSCALLFPFMLNGTLWLATVWGLVMIFSGRWRPLRSWRCGRGKR
jgi:hypothetical protein